MNYRKCRCEICKITLSTQMLTRHLKKIHNIITYEDNKRYYDTYALKESNYNKCKNKFCDNDTQFKNVFDGYHMLCKNKKCLVDMTCWFKKEAWINKGYTEQDAILKVSEIQKCNCSKTVEKRKKNPENYTIKNPLNLEYWIAKGYTEEDAILQRKKRQRTFTLEKCIEKDGLEAGTIRWQQRQDKWQNTLNSKSIEDKIEMNRKKMWNKGSISSTEKQLFDKLKVSIDCESQFGIYKEKCYIFDIRYKNKLIEFNGDYWHGNPLYFKYDYFNKSKQMLVSDIWEYDRIKTETANSLGYDVLSIWENDYLDEPDNTVNKCLKFLENNND